MTRIAAWITGFCRTGSDSSVYRAISTNWRSTTLTRHAGRTGTSHCFASRIFCGLIHSVSARVTGFGGSSSSSSISSAVTTFGNWWWDRALARSTGGACTMIAHAKIVSRGDSSRSSAGVAFLCRSKFRGRVYSSIITSRGRTTLASSWVTGRAYS